MSPTRRALGAGMLLLLALTSVSQSEPPQLLPRTGVLVLRSGRVLRGNILYEGDRYVIGLGQEDQVSVPQSSVAMHCADLEEAYLRQRAELPAPATAADHLALADWCLRYELTDAAADQLLAAQHVAPHDPAVTRFEKRLRVAVAFPAAAPQPTAASAFVTQEELDALLVSLPAGTVERFTNTIQPLLINRCGAGGCHGPTASNALQLFFSGSGSVIPRRFTQRNLKTVLAFLDRETPISSPLLERASTPHGGCAQPPLGHGQDAPQLLLLSQWVQSHLAGSQPASPSLAGDPHSVLPQPAEAPVDAVRRADAEAAAGQRALSAARPDPRQNLLQHETGSAEVIRPVAAEHATSGYQAVDPFDPEVFNRRYGSRR